MNLLIRSLDHHWHHRNDYFVGGNMFLYYSAAQVKNKDFRDPDFFVVLDVDRTQDRKYWAIWEEGGKYPDVIIESLWVHSPPLGAKYQPGLAPWVHTFDLLSDSTATIDTQDKKHLYERTFKTADYFVYDPYAPQSLQGWHLGQDQRYQEIPSDSRGWLWSPSLGLWLGICEGEIDRDSTLWLRFYDAEHHLVLLPEEAAQQQAEQAQQQAEQAQQQAEQERLRAERLAEQLRSLGIHPAD
jgi:Uma2 family endonuclease